MKSMETMQERNTMKKNSGLGVARPEAVVGEAGVDETCPSRD